MTAILPYHLTFKKFIKKPTTWIVFVSQNQNGYIDRKVVEENLFPQMETGEKIITPRQSLSGDLPHHASGSKLKSINYSLLYPYCLFIL